MKDSPKTQNRLVVLTNLFPWPWEPHRGAFNRQQFTRLESSYPIMYIVPVPIQIWLKNIHRFQPNRHGNRRYSFYLYIPKAMRWLYGCTLFFSVMLHSGLALLRFKPSVLIGSWAYPEGFAVALMARVLRLPYLIKVHGSDINDLLDEGLRGKQILWAMHGATGVISVSQALKNKLVERGVDPSKVHVIYNGVNKSVFNTQSGTDTIYQNLAINHQRYILYVGNVKATKGVFELFEAFVDVASELSELHLVFIGSGSDKKRLQDLVAESSYAQRVTLLDAMDIKIVANWIKGAKALILPSYNEGVPNVVLEAKSCGVPVVATTVGGIPEVFTPGEDGILVPPKEVAALAEALKSVVSKNWNREKISKNADSFCWNRNIQQLTSIIEQANDQRQSL